MYPGGQPGTDLAVLGGDPRSTVGGGGAATALDDASDCTGIISASTAIGAIDPKTKTSAPIVKRPGGGSLSLATAWRGRGAVLEE